MELPKLSFFFLAIFLFSLLQSPTFADIRPYIVYLGEHNHSPQPTEVEKEQVRIAHYNLLGSVLGSVDIAKGKIFYSYTQNINGFAAVIDDHDAVKLLEKPGVVSVLESRSRTLFTTHSWTTLGVEDYGANPTSFLWEKTRFGEDTIIANLDSGVWPESRSFSDEGYGPIPSRWKGSCQTEDGVRCNKKLIGARYFNKAIALVLGNSSISLDSARDFVGHGSHTLSTAGGNFVPGVSMFGGNGTAKGGSPKARVASYRVCFPTTNGNDCYDADILAAFDAAISDGVDVISLSLGGLPGDFFNDAIAIGSFHAVKNGITVVASAGNTGPNLGSVTNGAPWLLTTGASTIDREFDTYVELGNNKSIKGTSFSFASLKPSQMGYSLISAANARLPNAIVDNALLCKAGTLDPIRVKGKIVLCLRGGITKIEKGQNVLEVGGAGMILANNKDYGDDIIAEFHVLPASHISFNDGQFVFAYINSTSNPTAYITPVKIASSTKLAPNMASFSARGPSLIEPTILKPDVTAPGVNIIAAYTEAPGPSGRPTNELQTSYSIMSGTSMSCAHVSGVVGLLKTLYPNWSPAAIKSAIMTSAKTRNNNNTPIRDANDTTASPFAYGAGHVKLKGAIDPGLVYDLTIDDYLNFLCGRGYNEGSLKMFTKKSFACPKSFKMIDFNYPSITIPDLSGPMTVTRRVKNVGSPGTYTARLRKLQGVSVSVSPSILTFNTRGEEKTFQVTFIPKGPAQPNYVFGKLIWSDGQHYVRSPLAVKQKWIY